jgi:hypothetical protein
MTVQSGIWVSVGSGISVTIQSGIYINTVATSSSVSGQPVALISGTSLGFLAYKLSFNLGPFRTAGASGRTRSTDVCHLPPAVTGTPASLAIAQVTFLKSAGGKSPRFTLNKRTFGEPVAGHGKYRNSSHKPRAVAAPTNPTIAENVTWRMGWETKESRTLSETRPTIVKFRSSFIDVPNSNHANRQ